MKMSWSTAILVSKCPKLDLVCVDAECVVGFFLWGVLVLCWIKTSQHYLPFSFGIFFTLCCSICWMFTTHLVLFFTMKKIICWKKNSHIFMYIGLNDFFLFRHHCGHSSLCTDMFISSPFKSKDQPSNLPEHKILWKQPRKNIHAPNLTSLKTSFKIWGGRKSVCITLIFRHTDVQQGWSCCSSTSHPLLTSS